MYEKIEIFRVQDLVQRISQVGRESNNDIKKWGKLNRQINKGQKTQHKLSQEEAEGTEIGT